MTSKPEKVEEFETECPNCHARGEFNRKPKFCLDCGSKMEAEKPLGEEQPAQEDDDYDY